MRLRLALVGFENELLMRAAELHKSGPAAASGVKAEIEKTVEGESGGRPSMSRI